MFSALQINTNMSHYVFTNFPHEMFFIFRHFSSAKKYIQLLGDPTQTVPSQSHIRSWSGPYINGKTWLKQLPKCGGHNNRRRGTTTARTRNNNNNCGQLLLSWPVNCNMAKTTDDSPSSSPTLRWPRVLGLKSGIAEWRLRR